MTTELRSRFNRAYTPEKYQSLLDHLEKSFPGQLAFRVSESPIFLPSSFRDKVLDTCESIVDQLLEIPKEDYAAAVPLNCKVAPTDDRPTIICIDFAICENDGVLHPALIELQACASLNYYQLELDLAYRAHYGLPDNITCFFSRLDRAGYLARMRDIILSDCESQNVPLVDFDPGKQKTKIDFAATYKHLGTPIICIQDLQKNSQGIFFEQEGKQIPVKRIYNRFIFDEMHKAGEFEFNIDLGQPIEADWVVHPNWFFGISKQIMPRLHHRYIPTSYYVHEFPNSERIEDFVLKPLFSFSGQGVNLNPTPEDIQMPDPENYILQRKIKFKPLFTDPTDELARAEIRIIYTWHPDEDRPKPTINLARMTKSAMSNVDHNRGAKIWTGGSIAYFPK